MLLNVRLNIFHFNYFYRNSKNGEDNGTLKKFVEYGICQLNYNDIKEYVSKFDINYNQFKAEINSKKIGDLETNPFYLNELVKYYLKNNCLPNKSGIMDEIVNSNIKLHNSNSPLLYGELSGEEKITDRKEKKIISEAKLF